MLDEITDKRIRGQLIKRAARLENEPAKQGDPLRADLAGSREIKVVKKRYRIIFDVDEDAGVVYIKGVGIRKAGSRQDVYFQAKKRLGLL